MLLDSIYLRSVIDAMSDMIRVITMEGRVAFTNKSFDKKFSGGQNTIGQRCYEVFGHTRRCEGCLSMEACSKDVPQQVIRRFNNRIYSVTVSPLRDENGRPMAMVEVFRDTTLEYNIKQSLLGQNAKMQKDLNLAHNLQQSLVKNVLPRISGYELCAGFFPCEAVSGDIYDCMVYGDKLVLYIADVSGHGVMPSMLSVFFSRTVRAACSLGLMLPSEIFQYTQKEFIALGLADSIYITAFVVVINIKTGRFTYANAGLSVEPVVFDGRVHELTMGAPPICRWFDNPEFKDDFFEMRKGDRLLLYSDGIYGPQSDRAARDRMYAFFSEENFESEQFIEKVRDELYVKREDDLTMLICERT